MNTQELLALRQTEVEAAAQAFKQAQAMLQLTQINYRLVHIDSQPEPLDGLVKNGDLSDREKIVAGAYFVVMGQLPQIKPKPKEMEDVNAPESAGGERETESAAAPAESSEAQPQEVAAAEPEPAAAPEATEGSGGSATE